MVGRGSASSFDPRSREGATASDMLVPHIVDVSIRAPVRERRRTRRPLGSSTGFDPRSREGATRDDGVAVNRPDVSIRAPVRERQAVLGR